MVFRVRNVRFVFPLGCVLLGGCQTIMNGANSLGDHLPVIGERCENWQCFTASGQEQSELNKRKEQSPGTAGASPAPGQPATAIPPAGATATPSPYDMTPEQLQSLPPPAPPEP